MGKYCKTCKKAVNANEKSYFCVACSCNMHLTPECTALSPAAITVIKELGMKAMLFCKNCVEQNERDILIDIETCQKLLKIDGLDVGEKLKNMERRLTDLVDEKIGNATKRRVTNSKQHMLLSLLLKLLQEYLRELKMMKTRKFTISKNV